MTEPIPGYSNHPLSFFLWWRRIYPGEVEGNVTVTAATNLLNAARAAGPERYAARYAEWRLSRTRIPPPHSLPL